MPPQTSPIRVHEIPSTHRLPPEACRPHGVTIKKTMLRKIAPVILACLTAIPLDSFSGDGIAQVTESRGTETIVLSVKLNTIDKGQFFVNRTADGDLLVKAEDLKAMGFEHPAGTGTVLDGERYISLRSMQGVTFMLQEKTLVLEITAEPELLPRQSLNFRPTHLVKAVLPSNNSAFFNYSANYATGAAYSNSGAGFSGELGVRAGEYLFLSDGNSIRSSEGRKYVRLMTNLTHDNRTTLQRTTVGDLFTPARDLGSGVNLGGIGVTKLYQMDPYLIRYPLQSVTGKVALPTDLEVLVNGQRIRTATLSPGEFELRDIANYGGAQSVQLVLRDPFGRVEQISYPFYFSDQPLQQGLHEYSYNLGTLRRNFGIDSNNYGPAAFSVFHRYGVSNAFTLGLRAEGKAGLSSGGPLATYVMGSAGIANLSLSASRISGQEGYAGLLGYSYQNRNWNAGVSLRRDTRFYATLTEPEVINNRKYEGNAVAGYSFPGMGAISLSHSVLITYSAQDALASATTLPFTIAPLQNRRATTLSYSVPIISGSTNFSVSLNHIKEQQTRTELFVSLVSYFSKGHSASANYQKTADNHAESLLVSKNQPIGEGLGYSMVAQHTSGPDGDAYQLNPIAQYNAPSAILRGEYGRRQDPAQSAETYQVSVAGSVAYIGGGMELGRPVTDSFGVVKVGELEGVRVSVNGQEVGRTDSHGKVFVPTLTSYADNQVAISPDNVPIEYSLGETLKYVSPSLRSGTILDFGVNRIQAVNGTLKAQIGGEKKPVEFREITLSAEGKPMKYPTGHDGEFYLENLKAGTYQAEVDIEGRPCIFEVAVPKSDEPFIDLGELVCRPAP